MSDFRVRRWAAWAPGLQTQEAWGAWLAAPAWPLPAKEAVAPLAEVPAMTRRRIDPLGRAALQVAWWAQGDAPTGPVVFASRWGEIARSVALLKQLAEGEALSPTSFSLSVHNASSALYSIARGDTANYSALSAGPASAAAGVCEALGLLADGAPQVLVVSVEGELPEPYQSFEKQPGPLRAWAALLESADSGLRLRATPPETVTDGEPAWLPPDLATLRFLAGSAPSWEQRGSAGGWSWSRHG
ncbi:beta-ketoacyl synthase chain length factor [Pelomonas sp. V22]|uniref:beta-ketoacyl synthase chain length factor n=1 Tax=Pelomonas sp. V22 TaxID=2822139 RepID=UPI0024A8905B|nr:beta-ketoacyl synthase chain length factor [Pelomonas sp. V22]MDI4635516.1 beta-ketoacyl synthase chain length factor [Pelomonas sp. V22]